MQIRGKVPARRDNGVLDQITKRSVFRGSKIPENSNPSNGTEVVFMELREVSCLV
jgi:hypothetical protein